MASIILAEQVIMINYDRYGHDLRRLIAASTKEQGKQCPWCSVFSKESRLCAWAWICRLNGRKLDDAVEGYIHVSSTCNPERNKCDVGNYLSLNFNAQATIKNYK